MRPVWAVTLTIALFAIGTLGAAAAEGDAEDEFVSLQDNLVVIEELERVSREIQLEIIGLRALVAQPKTFVADVDGSIVVLPLDAVDRLLPLAQSALAEDPQLRDIVQARVPGFDVAIDTFVTFGDITGLIADEVKKRLVQDEAAKQAIVAPRLDELEAELLFVDGVIAALKEDLGGLTAFPPIWLDGKATVAERFGTPPLDRPPDWHMQHPASGYEEACWTMDEDGLHYCANADGWASVYLETPGGYRWYDIDASADCVMTILGSRKDFTTGSYDADDAGCGVRGSGALGNFQTEGLGPDA